MGFPRILSKNNKIYTKLGEFCLSIDGNQFYIVCHTCQQESLTQDTFWKHIQDEHSFMHELKHQSPAEHNRQHNQSFIESTAAAMSVDVPPPAAALVQHYHKINIKDEHDGTVMNEVDGVDGEVEEEEEEDQEPKDYTEMRVIEPSAVEVNIKVEQTHMPMVSELTTDHQQQQQQHHAPTTLYMPSTGAVTGMPSTQVINYSSILQNMPQVCAVISPGAGVGLHNAAMPPKMEALKDSSSANSEDGERWYICDYKPCGQKFKYLSRLQLHSTVHSKERRFVCEVCNASFKQSCNLSTHRKKKHDIRTARMIK